MKDISREQLKALRKELCSLVSQTSTIRLIAADAGLRVASIDMNGPAELVWHNVLEESGKLGALQALLQEISNRYPANDLVRSLVDRPPASGPHTASSGQTAQGNSAPHRQATQANAPPRKNVLISYSHEDRRYVEELRKHLKPLEARGLLTLWDDFQILAGAMWRQFIDQQVAPARYGVLMISPDFLASSFIIGQELPPLLKAAATGELTLLLIFARPSMAQLSVHDFPDRTGPRKVALTDFQGLNSPEKPLSSLSAAQREEELVAIAGKLVKAVLDESRLVSRVRFTVPVEVAQFDASGFIDAISDVTGVVPSDISIIDVKAGSTVVTLGGAAEALDHVVDQLRSSQNVLSRFIERTGATRLEWEVNGSWFRLELIPRRSEPDLPPVTVPPDGAGTTNLHSAGPERSERPPKRRGSKTATTKLATALVVAANPARTTPLDLNREVEEIRDSIKRARNRRRYKVEPCWVNTWRELRRAIQENEATILHIAGHGGLNEGIILADERGDRKSVPWNAVASLVREASGHLKCVVLNMCYSAAILTELEEHIDYIVGSESTITDSCAREFAVAFYDSLGQGKNYDEAFRSGQIAVEGFSAEQSRKLKLGGRQIQAARREELHAPAP